MKNSTIFFCLLICALSSLGQSNFKWKTLNANTTKNITDMYFHTPEIGYIVGDNYLFKKTTDGGQTWFDLTAPTKGEKPGNNGNLVGIDFHTGFSLNQLDSGLYLTWEKGYHGVVTKNDGNSYSTFGYLDSNIFCNIKGFKILPENKGNGYLNMFTYGQSCSGKPIFYNYYDGPFAFAHSDSLEFQNNATFTAVDRDSLFTIFGSSDGFVWRYPWVTSKPDSIYLDSTGITSVASAGSHTWYAASNSGRDNMFISLDSGKSFSKDTSFPQTFHYPEIHDMSFVSPKNGISVASSNVRNGVIIIRHANGWFHHSVLEPLKTAKLFKNQVAYVAGDNGLIMKSNNLDTTIGIEEKRVEAFKIFPNPTSDKVSIEIANDLRVESIRLLNITGIEIKRFHSYQKELDLTNISEGTYLLEIVVDGQPQLKKVVKW